MVLNSVPKVLVGVAATVFLGCGVTTTPPLPVAAPPQVATETKTTQDHPAEAANPILKPPAAVDEPAVESVTQNQPAATNDASNAPAPAAPKKTIDAHPKPSAELISKWAMPDYSPLKLLACNDGFDDNLVLSMSVTSDGQKYALGGFKLTLWNSKESQPFAELSSTLDGNEWKRPVRSVAISPDAKIVAAGDQRGKVRLWNLANQQEIGVINAHEGHITQIAIAPDSQRAATTSYSGEVRIWELPGGKKLKSLKVSSQELTRLAFLSDTLLAATGSEGAWIWNIESGEKVTDLTEKNVIGPALGLSHNRRWLAVNDSQTTLKLWDVEKSSWSGLAIPGVSAHLIRFSHDGKWLAVYSNDSSVRILDADKGRVMQTIPADGGRISDMDWLPGSHALMMASESGRVRIWGDADAATANGLEPLALPDQKAVAAGEHRSLSSAQFQNLIDLRSLPRLPDARPQFEDYGMCGYSAPASQADAEMFYRYILEQAGWKELAPTVESTGGLVFGKDGCHLNVSLSPAIPGSGAPEGHTQVSLNFAGNYDARWLPRVSAIDSKSSWNSFSSVSYRTKADLLDLEVGLLKQLHEQGWTPFSRLNAMGNEDPLMRNISLLQDGSILNIFIGVPADAKEEFFVQTSIQVSNKTLPVPADCGWIEFDNSTDVLLVATTSLSLEQAVEFYDKQMANQGWLSRHAGRHVKDGKAWLPFIRGQQDTLVRLTSLEEGGTRIIVGDVQNSSWQLQDAAADKAEARTDAKGVEAADFKLPAGATAVKYDVDQKKIDYALNDKSPQLVGEEFVKQMEALGWKQDGAGIISDDYVFITFAKEKAEIQLRARGKPKEVTAMISGDGLLWSKPLPAAPERVSYATWLRRNHQKATLELVDEYAAEMRKIPATKAK